jgi:mRNA degradation ribonuclease J1/J2
LTADSLTLGENVPAGTRLIDGEGVEDYGTSEVMKDRLKMSADGVCAVALATTGGYVIGEPEIETHGCVFAGADMQEELRAVVSRAVESCDSSHKDEFAAAIKRAAKNYFYKKTRQAPLIVVSVVEV